MSVTRTACQGAALLACLGMLLPQGALAAPLKVEPHDVASRQDPRENSQVLDVALDAAGYLHGQVTNQDGAPLANVHVVVSQQQRPVGETITNSDGWFVIAGLRGGVYQIESSQSQVTWRVWAPGAAPPSAQRAAMVVARGDTLRGQNGTRRFVIPTLIVAGLIGTAIAVPLAVSNSNNDGS